MAVTIAQEPVSVLPLYAVVSPAFLVEARFAVIPIGGGLGGLSLKLEPVEPAYVKDYDRDEGEGPECWLERWDISRWGLFSVFDSEKRVGGALIAWDTPKIDMLDGRQDLAALWDIRVHADFRRSGIGTALFSRSVDWARERGCVQLKIETQNVNVPACRFYARQGCTLAAIDPYAYPNQTEEIQLIWQLDL